MDVPRRRETPPERQTLADSNAALRADKAALERDVAALQERNLRLEQRYRALQVLMALLLAATLGLATGLTVTLAGSGATAALGTATSVFFAVVMTSMAVLSYIRR